MKKNEQLYNSRITKIYLEFISKHYPHVNIDSLLEYAGMARYEVEDPAHWFTQHQVDLFQEKLVKESGNPNISREAGRYATTSKGIGPTRQYTLGLMSLSSIYLLMGRVYALMSRGSKVKAKRLKSNKVEITAKPNDNVSEKPYQCENRIGTFEAVAKLFTPSFAKIEHPECIHKGDLQCIYIISWEDSISIKFKRLRNIFLLASIIFSSVTFFLLSPLSWLLTSSSLATILILFSFYIQLVENRELVKTIESQGNVAKDYLDEINKRYNDSILIQEIGNAISTTLNVDKLLNTVIKTMKNRLHFDRAIIMLSDEDKTKLTYSAGFGYSDEDKTYLKNVEFNLKKPDSKGTMVLAFKEKKPFLLNNIGEIKDNFSPKSRELAEKMGSKITHLCAHNL